MAHHNVGVISFPTGRFAAAASLTLRFRAEQSFLGASGQQVSFARKRECNVAAETATAGYWSRRRYHRT